MSLEWFPVGVLGVWRIAHLLVAENGPADVIVRLRTVTSAPWWGNLLDCFYCVSVWVAMPFALALADTWIELLLLWPALSGGAILLDRIGGQTSSPPTALYLEHEPQPVRSQHDLLSR
jgi:hypothetical protein